MGSFKMGKETWVAFRVDAEAFLAFADGLASGNIRADEAEALKRESVVVDCYDHERVKQDMIRKHDITAVRFW